MRNYRQMVFASLVLICGVSDLRADGAGDTTDRILRKQIIVKAPVEEVWRRWTTEEGIATFFSPNSKIDLKLGGAFDILFDGKAGPDGKRGAEGMHILSYIPNEMLAFEWGFPPAVQSLRDADERTQVVVRLIDLGDGRVKVKFAQLGWKKGADWDKGYEYFDKAWGWVLGNLKEQLESGDETGEKSPAREAAKTWKDHNVKVTSISGPVKTQIFEMTIPASVEKVWDILATSEGFRKLGAKEPNCELRPGGAYSFWPGAPNKVLAFVPHEMLSTSGSAPPEFPNVRKGGTWSAYFFKKDDKQTKLRLVCVGWRPGEKEWDQAFDYFLKNNPKFLNAVYAKLTNENSSARAQAKKD